MKLHLPNALRRLLLASLIACAVTVSDAAVMHSGVSLITYTDFGQNLGRYAVGNTNALLNYIRLQEGGVKIIYVNPEVNAAYILPQDMIDFSSQNDGGYGAAVGYNFYATVQHNGVHTNTYSGNYIGAENAIIYQSLEYRSSSEFLLTPSNDYKISRQSKLITDVTGSTVYVPDGGVWTAEAAAALQGRLLYRAGSGTMNGSNPDGSRYGLTGAYAYTIGGVATITNTAWYNEEDGAFSTNIHMNDYSLSGINDTYPIPFASMGGDSGSPAWIWNETTGRYEYLTALQSGNLTTYSQFRSAPKYTVETMASFNVNVDLTNVSEVHLGAVDVRGTDITDTDGRTAVVWKGKVYDGDNHVIAEYKGMRGDSQVQINTWKDLSDIKDTANWYHYGNEKLNTETASYQDYLQTSDLVFTATTEVTSIQADADVDLGAGYIRLCKGDLDRARFNIGGSHLINSAGYIVDGGVDAYITLTNSADYMREWRAVVETGATLHIEGSGDTNALLNLGGQGTTYLNRTDGYAAYNVLANNGTHVVISDINQIKRDFTFGFRGGVLDMNGNSMTWNNANGAAADGFTIHALDEQAMITNAKAGSTTTLTWTQGGEQTWLGSFVDTKDGGALKFVYDGGAGSTLTLRSIHTDLHNAGSGITVASGTVKLEGTNTIHGKGSLSGRNSDRYFSKLDWHYVDMTTPVTVQDGGTFELGSHARITGNVTVNGGGTFIMREGVQKPYEYVEGGQLLEDTSIYQAFYGLKGDIANDGAVRIEFSEGTTSTNYYTGAISGSGSLTINTGSQGGAIVLSGANTSTGTRTVTEGIVILANADALGTGSIATGDSAWKIGEKAWLAVDGVDQTTILTHIHTESNGALALTQDTATTLDMSNHADLFIGAAAGLKVDYGERTMEDLATWHVEGEGENARHQWLFGGGGGEIVVHSHLTGDNDLVLGNPYMSGTVTLTNRGNDFTGSIIFTRGSNVVLDFTDPLALGGAHVDLSYGKAINGGADIAKMLEGSTINTSADGILIVDGQPDADIDLTGHTSLQLGANKGEVHFSGSISVVEDGTYRLGGPGHLVLDSALAANGTNDLIVDAQGFNNGSVTLNAASGITGAVTVMGHDATKEASSGITGGDISLVLAADNALAGASSVTVMAGGELLIGAGSTQTIKNLQIQSGTGVYGMDPANATLRLESGSISGAVDVARIEKISGGTLTVGAGNNMVFGTMDIQAGSLNLAADMAGSGSVTLHSGAGITFNGHYLAAALDIADGGTWKPTGQATIGFKGANTHLSSGGVLDLTGVTTVNLMQTAGNTGQHFMGTVKLGNTELYSRGGVDNMAYEFDHLDVGGNAYLRQTGWNTLWNIHSLTGSGPLLQYDVNTQHSISSVLRLDGAGDFSGTLRMVKYANGGNRYQSYLVLQHEEAAKNAVISLWGWNSSNYAVMAINTERTQVRGLDNSFPGNAVGINAGGHAIILAGDAAAPTNDAPASTRNTTLVINTQAGDNHTYYGGFVGSLQNAISLVKTGAGTQTLTNGRETSRAEAVTAAFRDVTVLAGTLNLNNSNVYVYGDYGIGQGATLNVARGITLAEGHSLIAMNVDGKTGSATYGSALTLAGGSLAFSGAGLESLASGTYLLNLTGTLRKAEGQTGLAVGFTDVSYLQEGKEYLLASGNFGALGLTYTATGVDFYNASFTATSSGLAVTFSVADTALIWNGTDAAHSWSDTVFSTKGYSSPAGKDFVFTNTAANKNVAVAAEGLHARGLTIVGTGYSFSGNALTVDGALNVYKDASATFGLAVSVGCGVSVGEGATAKFAGLNLTGGTVSLADASKLTLTAGESAFSLTNASTGTLEVQRGASVDLKEVNGAMQYHLAGDGDISMAVVGSGNYVFATTDNTFNGKLTIDLRWSHHFILGTDATTAAAFADGYRPDIELVNGNGNAGFILNNYYSGIDRAFNIGSLSSASTGAGFRGDWQENPAGQPYRFVSVHQDVDTTFAGLFYDKNDKAVSRSIGLIMNGAGETGGGTLTLTNSNWSTADLIINSGTVALSGNGRWNGDVTVNDGGQIFVQRNDTTGNNGTKPFNDDKTLTISGDGVQAWTDASGIYHEARRGALKLDSGITLTHGVEVAAGGASVMTEAAVTGDNAATISGEISGEGVLTKVGAGTLKLSGHHTASGDLVVEEGTLTLVNGVEWLGGITVQNGAALTTTGAGSYQVQGTITRHYTSGVHSDTLSALESSTESVIHLGNGTELNLDGGDFSGVAKVVGGVRLTAGKNGKGAVIGGVSTVNVNGVDLRNATIYGGSDLNQYQCTSGISSNATLVDLRAGSTVDTVFGGHLMDSGGSGEIQNVSLGSTMVKLDGATVTGSIYGGSLVVRNNGGSTVTQGDLVVALGSGSVGGNVYAGGKQVNASKLATESTEVRISSAVSFNGSNQIISGGYETSKTNSTISGTRTLTLTDSGDYSNIASLSFREFNVIDSAADVTLGDFTTSGTLTKKGTGEVTLTQAHTLSATAVQGGMLAFTGGATFTGDVTVEEGATLSLGGAISLTNAIQSAGTVNFSGVTFSVDTSNFVGGRYYIVRGPGETTGSLALTDFTITGDSGSVRLGGAGTNEVYLYDANSSIITWNGTEDAHVWDTTAANWLDNGDNATSFTTGGSVNFTDAAGNKDVVLGAASVEAAEINIFGTDYIFSGGEVRTTGDLTMVNGSSATFDDTLVVGGSVILNDGATLTLNSDTTLPLAANDPNTGTLAVGKDSTVNLGNVKGTAKYKLAGDGTVKLSATQGGNYILASTDNTFSGTLEITLGSSYVIIGEENSTGTNFAEGANPDIVLKSNGDSDKDFVLNNNFHGKGAVLDIGSLATDSASVTISGANGSQGSGDFRYIALHQDGPTTFAGTFADNGNRSVGLMMNGSGTLTLTGDSASTAGLFIKSGTVVFSGSGNWAGEVSVENGGQLHLQNSPALGADKPLTIAGTGVAGDADSAALKLATGVSLAHAVTIADGGASIMVGGDGEASISGAISGGALTKTGTGTLTLSGNVIAGSITVESGTLALTGGTTTLTSAIVNKGTVEFGGATFALSDSNFTNGRFDFVTGSGTTTGTLTAANFSGVDVSTLRIKGLGTGNVYLRLGMATLTWNGTAENNAWNTAATDWLDEDNAADAFGSGSVVRFTGAAANKAVVVDAAGVSASSITITGTGYAFSGGKVSSTGGLTLENNASATFQGGVQVGGATVVKNGATLAVQTDAALTVAANDTNTGTLSVGADATLDLGDVNGTAKYKLAGDGKVEMNATGENYILFSTGNTFSGTLKVNLGGSHYIIGAGGNADATFANGANPDLSLTGGGNGSHLILNNNYQGTGRVLDIGSLTGAAGVVIEGGNGGNATETPYRYLSVHQGKNTTFAGTFANTGPKDGNSDGSRAIGLIMNGTHTLTLTGDNKSTAGLIINSGTVALSGSGNWAGNVTVGDGGQLYLQRSNALNSGATLTISGNGVAAGENNAARPGALKLDAVTLAHDVAIGEGGASIAVDSGTATVSGAISGGALTKTGAGTLALSGGVTATGITVEAGTLSLTGGTVSLASSIVNSGTVDFGGASFTVDYSNFQDGRFYLVTGTGSTSGSLALSNITVNGFTGDNLRLSALGGNEVYLYFGGADGPLTWAGTDAGHTWGGSNWKAGDDSIVPFTEGREVFFTSTAANKDVVVGDAGVTASGMRISDTGYTFSGGAITNEGELTLGASATFNNTSFSQQGDVAVAASGATLTTGADTTVTLSGGISGGTLTKDGAGKLSLASAATVGADYTLSGGTLEVAVGGNLGNISVTGDSALHISHSNSRTVQSINISQDATLSCSAAGGLTFGLSNLSGAGTLRFVSSGGAGNRMVNIAGNGGFSGTLSLEDFYVRVHITEAGAVDGAKLNLTNGAWLWVDANTNISGLTGSGTGTTLNGNGSTLTINVADGESYKYTGSMSALRLVKEGAGTQIISSAPANIAVNAGRLEITSAPSNSTMTVAAGATLKLTGSGFRFPTAVASDGTVIFSSGATLGTLNKSNFTDNRYNIVTGTGTTEGTLGVYSSYLTGFTNAEKARLRYKAPGGSEVYLVIRTNDALVWDGTDDSHTWEGKNWLDGDAATHFLPGVTSGTWDSANFTDAAANKNVVIAASGATAAAVTVSGTGYTFTGGSLAASALTLEDGASASFNNAGFTVPGAISLGSGSTLGIGFDTTLTNALTVGAGGARLSVADGTSVAFSSAISGGALKAEVSGMFDVEADTSLSSLTFGANGSAKVATGRTVLLTSAAKEDVPGLFDHVTTDATHTGTISLGLGKVDNQLLKGTHDISANFRFTGTTGIEFNNWNKSLVYDSVLNVTENGSLTVDNGNLALTSYSTMNIQGGSVTAPSVTVGTTDGNTPNCAHLTLSAGSLTTGSILLKSRSADAVNNVTSFQMTGGELNLTSGSGDAFAVSQKNTGYYNISLTGGTVNVAAARNMAADVTLGGVTIHGTAEGAGITFAAGKTVTWDSLITNDAAALTFNGTIALAADALDGVTPTYYDSRDTESGNGYKLGKLLVQNTNGGTVSVGSAATLTVGGMLSTESLVSTGTGLYTGGGTLYYVNSGTLAYGADTNSAASENTTGIVLQADTTVTISADATLTASQVDKNGHALTLDGTGTFINASGNTMAASMAGTWKGTVEISGISDSPLIIHNYGTGAGSTVRFKGVNGWIQVNNTSINENIEFAQMAEGAALNITGTSVDRNYAFNGSISGVGDMALATGNNNNTFTFSGDVSQWTGSLNHTNTAGTTTLKFTKDGDMAIGMAAITHTGDGTLDVQVSGSGAKTFGGTLSGAKLTMNGSGSLTLTEAATLSGLSVSSGTLTLSGGATLSGAAAVTGGTLSLGGDVSLASAISSSGTVEFNGASFSLTAADFTDNRFNIVTGSGTTSGTINLSVPGSGTPVRVAGLGSGSVYAYLGSGELTWDGTSATGGEAWGNANWILNGATTSFETGDTVYFTASAENKAVTVAAAGVSTGTMEISGTGYTFSGGAISATSLTLGNGVTATFQNALTVTSAVTLNNSTLKFATDGDYNVGMDMTGTGNVEVSGTGAKTIGGKLTDVTLTMNGTGTLGFTQQLAMENGKLVINSGTVTVDQVSNGVSQLKNTAIEVYGGGTLTVQHDTMGWADNSCVTSILLQGSSETKLAVLDNNDTDTGNNNRGNTSRVALNLAGHALVKDTGSHGIRVWDGMTISAIGTDNTISSALVVDKPLTITVGDADHPDSTLLISGNLSNSSDCANQALTKAGSGTLTLSGSNNASGAWNLDAGTLKVTQSGNMTLNGGNTHTGTLEVAKDAAVGVTTASGTIEYHLSGEGKVTLGTITGDLTFASTGNTLSGTLDVDTGNSGYFVLGNDTKGSGSVFDGHVNLVLTSAKGVVINNAYATGEFGEESDDPANALQLGSLAAENAVEVRGDWVNGSSGYRYIQLNQEAETTFAGKFLNVESRSVGIVMNGPGVFELTNENTSVTRIIAGMGTVAFSGSGTWGGDIEVHAGGQLDLQKSGVMATGKTLTLAGDGVEAWTDAAGNGHAARKGALVLAKGVEVANAITISEAGASIMVDGEASATISGAISGSGALTKVGGGTLRLDGADTCSGATTVQEGTLALGSDASIANGRITLANNSGEGVATIRSARIEGGTISGLEGGGQISNLKVLYENSKVTFENLVISADSHIGKEPVAQTFGLVESTADGATTEAAMSASTLKLETGKNASLGTTTATAVITRKDGKPDIAAGTALSLVDCSTFNVDVLSGSLTLDLTSLWDAIVAQNTQYLAVDFSGVSSGFAEGTTIQACANGWSPVEAISYGSAGGHVVYFEIAQIPEPATATLSILALAGLLARRRRRH